MTSPISRRTFLQTMAAQSVPAVAGGSAAAVSSASALPHADGWIRGKMSGARALVEALLLQGTGCVFGIPGAQQNELWDTMKQRGLAYQLVTHEFSASAMADGYARSTGRPGVLCVVPGPGVTNALTGIGEALLDSIPLVCVVGDVARGENYRPFQVHELPQVGLLQQVTKQVYQVRCAAEIPLLTRQAFIEAAAGEPGPVAVVVPYDLLFETCKYNCPPPAPAAVPFDEAAVDSALALLSCCKYQIGIYAGLGCMDYAPLVPQVAELLQAPVATTVSGKGVIDERHCLSVGVGYGKQGTRTAESIFSSVDVVLAIGVRYGEVATAFYNIPKHRHLIHVDINPNNLGRVVPTDICVNADAGLFLSRILACETQLRRSTNGKLVRRIQSLKSAECKKNAKIYARCGADPMALLLELSCRTNEDAQVFVDVTLAEHWAAEVFQTRLPRTYFNPADNQAMGWSIPAAIGAQRARPCRQTITITGDGCFLMSAMEIATAVRDGLPVKFFVLDDQVYHTMQKLQEPAYQRTTATVLPRLDYASLAAGWGIAYNEILSTADLGAGINTALYQDGPVLTRVAVDYGKRTVRWMEAVKERFIDELTVKQQIRFLARVGSRSLDLTPAND